MNKKSLLFVKRQHIPSQLKMAHTAPLTSEYKNQVGGRTTIVKIFGDHILKPTTIYEVNSYLKMTASISAISPDCCSIISNGKFISLRHCHSCSDMCNLNTINALLNMSTSGHYLIMRDAAYGMSRPRLLDLKLGTRTHSDFVSEEKKRSHIRKSMSTTSTPLGLRLCGASFHEFESTEKTVISKMEGRSMTTSHFFNAMAVFFQIPERQKNLVIQQLMKIKQALENCDSHRFFGSSLLIAIDDGYCNDFIEKSVKVKLIDFSSMARSEPGDVQYHGSDAGAILGVSTLIQLLEKS